MFSKKRFCLSLICIITLIISCFLFTSCRSDDVNADGEMLSFTDALGRDIYINKTPKRVAALLGSFADIWILSGGDICASADDAWDDFGLDLKDAVNIGGAHSPSLELLISASPDFVLASASTASNVEMKDSLEAMGITVAYFDVDNFDDYLKMLKICTDITGCQDLYEQNGVKIKEQIETVKDKYAGVNISDNERKILLLRASSTSLKAKGSEGTILGEMLSDMGCVNIADSDGTLLENLSVEAIIRNEPHHIFVVTMGSDTDAVKSALDNLIKENPAWSTLEAVKENRLHVMEKTLFNLKPNSRWAEAYEKLYEVLTEK